jgi:hypothetical protein
MDTNELDQTGYELKYAIYTNTCDGRKQVIRISPYYDTWDKANKRLSLINPNTCDGKVWIKESWVKSLLLNHVWSI